MSEPHRIRLHGPWEVRPHVPGVAAGRMTIPGTLRDGGWPEHLGAVSFYRRFGRPTNLGTGDVVRLAFAAIIGPAEIMFNGERLGAVSATGQFDVTERLCPRNELEVMITEANDRSGIVGEVVLEISTQT